MSSKLRSAQVLLERRWAGHAGNQTGRSGLALGSIVDLKLDRQVAESSNRNGIA